MTDLSSQVEIGKGIPQRSAMAVVVGAYLAVTVAESVLAPLFPAIAADLGLNLQAAGSGFGLLTGGIAVGNLVGGFLSKMAEARWLIATSLLISAAGSWLAASSHQVAVFLGAQIVIGLGTGIFFAPGLQATARLAGIGRRGLAMGIFGVAFSGGLAVAAFLAAAGAEGNWRVAFWTAAIACAVAVGPALLIRLPKDPGGSKSRRLYSSLRRPILVGTVGTLSQYGTVGFLALYAVSVWKISAVSAALLIAVARLLSMPAKLLVGAAADRFGSIVTLKLVASLLVGSGLVWTVLMRSPIVVGTAVVFAAAVSALFPIANLLAIEQFGDHADLLGKYRSAQIAIGATVTWLIGVIGERFALRPTLIVCAVVPAILFAIRGQSTG